MVRLPNGTHHSLQDFEITEENGFHDTRMVSKALYQLQNPKNIAIINKELEKIESEESWKEWPELGLWKEDGSTARWTVFSLFGFGKWSSNTKICPELTRLLKTIPGLKTAGFSCMAPGTTLKIHAGWAKLANTTLRSHLLLTSHPLHTCFLWVNGKHRYHETNSWITFDDSLPHTASNGDNKDRIILLVDIERPSWIPRGKSNVQSTMELGNFLETM
jgi:hypothetical protein